MTSRYGRNSASRWFQLDSVESMLTSSSYLGSQASQHELMVFERFAMIVRAQHVS